MASANNLGTAYIKIAPQMQGIQKSISDGLAGIKSTSLPGATALGTVIAKGVSAAMNIVTNSLDDAIKRTDVINNFPKVMSNIGIGADEAQESIDTLKKKLDGLPTSLQAGAMAVQRFTSKNSDIKKSTDLFLALNNAILAGGAPAEIQATAIEQMSQAYAKGKPDMMEWRAIQSAMPAQLRQISIAMGYGADGVAELGEALRHNEVSMDDFMNTIVKLNKEGANGFQSFEQQAKNSTDGIGTALTNVKNRAAAAIQQVIQSFGAKDVSEAINNFSSSFSGIATWISDNIIPIIKNQLVPVIKNVLTVAKNVVEFVKQNQWVQTSLRVLLDTLIAFKAVSIVKTAVSNVVAPIASMVTNIGGAISAFKGAHAAGLTFASSLGTAASASSGAVSAVAGLGSKAAGLVSALGVGGVASIAGLATTALLGLKAATIGDQTENNKAATAAREYSRAHYTLKQASDQVAGALKAQQQATEDLKSAQVAANDAEYAAILAEKAVIEAEEHLKQLRKDGKEGTDEYRLAELDLQKALKEDKIASDDLRQAKKQVAEATEDIENATIAQITTTNKSIGTTLRDKGALGELAAQLDSLKGSTLTYTDANGNMVQTTTEKTENMVNQVAEDLARGNSEYAQYWRKVVDLANTEGLSYVEACRRVGEESGSGFIGSFAVSAEGSMHMVTEVGQGVEVAIRDSTLPIEEDGANTGQNFVDKLVDGIASKYGISSEAGREAIKKAFDSAYSGAKGADEIGRELTTGTGLGILDTKAIGALVAKAAAMVRKAINAMKAEADIHSPSKETATLGKFMSLGLAEGIDDYADEAVKAAEDMTYKTLEAMNKTGSFDGLIQSQVQPQTSLVGDAEGAGNKVIQNNTFEVNSELDVKEISKRLGWQVATAL